MQIGSCNDSEAVREQYAVSDGLNTRLSFHERYSTNPQGFGNWLVSNYEIEDGASVLEIGCGTGSLWEDRDALMARCKRLVLTDLSEGMLETARRNLGERENLAFLQADIQSLPFSEDVFDVVIANAMLYHVPDLAKGISEVCRVLKPDGVFYCSTYGEHNFTETLAEWFRLSGEEYRPNRNFTMENGAEALKRSFENVEARFYEDSLRVTEPEALAAYLRSLISLRAVDALPDERILEILNSHVKNGMICLPKEYGMFLARGKR